MERINIDEDFMEWAIQRLPLHMVHTLYQAYLLDKKRSVKDKLVIIIEDVDLDQLPDKVFEGEIDNFKQFLDDFKK